jgi:hypothetical protein
LQLNQEAIRESHLSDAICGALQLALNSIDASQAEPTHDATHLRELMSHVTMLSPVPLEQIKLFQPEMCFAD